MAQGGRRVRHLEVSTVPGRAGEEVIRVINRPGWFVGLDANSAFGSGVLAKGSDSLRRDNLGRLVP